MDANQLFATKWPNVQKVVRFRAVKYGLDADTLDEVLQFAGLKLWEQCRRMAPAGTGQRINCRVIARAAWVEFSRRRDPVLEAAAPVDASETWTDNLPAHVTEIRVDGVRLTVSDAEADAPQTCETLRSGISSHEVQRRLGVCRERVRQLAPQLGGVFIASGRGGHWVFPAETGAK